MMKGLIAALGLVSLGFGCSTPRAYTSRPGAYDRTPEHWQPLLVEARDAVEEQDLDRAYEILTELAAEDPRIIPVRIFLQETELALGRAGRMRVESPEQAIPWLSSIYLDAAEANPSAEAYVLAARLQGDARMALQLVDQAERLDPRCVWVPYARAWWSFVDYRFTPAEDAVRAAFKLDPGHLPTMRLQAIVLTAAGETSSAIDVLEVWRKRAEHNPLISPEKRGAALLDLASLEVLAGRPREALRHLEKADPRVLTDLGRVEGVRAAAHEARDEFDLAFEAVRRASLEDPEDPLPIVQAAMIYARMGDEEAELATWRELLEHLEASDGPAFQALLFRLQAITRLQRAELAAASDPAAASDDLRP